MAHEDPAEVRALLRRTGMPARTDHTITDPGGLRRASSRSPDERGYALDDEEQEIGVRCVAVAVPGAPQRIAVSMSGPLSRMGDDVVERAAPLLGEAATAIAAELGARSA